MKLILNESIEDNIIILNKEQKDFIINNVYEYLDKDHTVYLLIKESIDLNKEWKLHKELNDKKEHIVDIEDYENITVFLTDKEYNRIINMGNDVFLGEDIQDTNKSEKDIMITINNYVRDIFIECAINSTIEEIWLHGSRVRKNAREDSDLDVVLFYNGEDEEDDLFNLLNYNPLYIDNIQVDINPINVNNWDIKDYKKQSLEYDKQILNKVSEEFPNNETKINHFNNHVLDPIDKNDLLNKYDNPDDYEDGADELAKQYIRHVSNNNKHNDNIVGYVDKQDDAYIKHNSNTNETVVYKPDKNNAPITGNRIITYYGQSDEKYERRKNRNFKRSIK